MENKKVFKILSIDGGGIKGLYSATILQHLEERFGGSISDYFDMLCGTSTGGLIALGISQKIPAKDMALFYEEKGPLIFPKRFPGVGLLRQVFWKGKFSDAELKKALEEKFHDSRIGQSHNLLCIPSYLVTEARPWVFKKDHAIEGGNYEPRTRDDKAKYVDVGLATSAAPTYLPMAELPDYDNKQFVDGGVWANNPTLCGYLEALTYFVGEGKPYDEVHILSLSSLSITGGKKTGLNRFRAFINWRNELFETAMTGQSFFTDYFMRMIESHSPIPVKYIRIPSVGISAQQESLIQLDVATPKALQLIKGKGNDQGEVYKKLPEIHEFFKTKKTYNP